MSRRAMIVTGGGRGVGAAVCKLGAAAGYDICVNYLGNTARAESVVAEIRDVGGRAISVQADVADRAQVLRLFERVDDELGPLTALVNNAAIAGKIGRLADADAQMMSDVVDANVKGLFWCSQEAVKRMSTRYGGSGGGIVNLSSGSVSLGSPGEYVWYAASKGAVDSFTIGLGKELAREGVRVNAVAPGIIDTEMHETYGLPDRLERDVESIPMGRAATPEDIAKSIIWLLSDDAAYTTATVVRVAGGR